MLLIKSCRCNIYCIPFTAAYTFPHHVLTLSMLNVHFVQNLMSFNLDMMINAVLCFLICGLIDARTYLISIPWTVSGGTCKHISVNMIWVDLVSHVEKKNNYQTLIMEIEVTPHVNVIISLASAPDSYNQPQLTDRNAFNWHILRRECSALEPWETLIELKPKHLKQNDTLFTVYIHSIGSLFGWLW